MNKIDPCTTTQVKCTWSQELADDLMAYHGINAEEELEEIRMYEITHRRKKAILEIFE